MRASSTTSSPLLVETGRSRRLQTALLLLTALAVAATLGSAEPLLVLAVPVAAAVALLQLRRKTRPVLLRFTDDGAILIEDAAFGREAVDRGEARPAALVAARQRAGLLLLDLRVGGARRHLLLCLAELPAVQPRLLALWLGRHGRDPAAAPQILTAGGFQ